MDSKLIFRFKLLTALILVPILSVPALSACSTTPVTSIPKTLPPSPSTSSITRPSPAPTPTPFLTPAPSSNAYTVNIANKANIGSYLVDKMGRTLYYTLSDPPGRSNITDELLTVWPVFYVDTIVVPPGLSVSDFTTIERDNGQKQTAYKGHPLYFLTQDKVPGDTLGNKVSGVWFVMTP